MTFSSPGPALGLVVALLLAGPLHCDGDAATSPSGGGSGGATTTSDEGGAPTTTSSTSTTTTTGGQGGGGGPTGPVQAQLYLLDMITGLPIPDAPVTLGDSKNFTNGFGFVVHFVDPGAAFELVAAPEEQLPFHLFGVADEEDFGMLRFLPSEAAIAEAGSHLGFAYDPSKAVVFVVARGVDASGDVHRLPGFEVDTDVGYDMAFVPEESAPGGHSQGNATLEEEESIVYFVNVPPGPVPLQITAPGGLACAVGPGDAPPGSEMLVAHEHAVSSITINCK